MRMHDLLSLADLFSATSIEALDNIGMLQRSLESIQTPRTLLPSYRDQPETFQASKQPIDRYIRSHQSCFFEKYAIVQDWHILYVSFMCIMLSGLQWFLTKDNIWKRLFYTWVNKAQRLVLFNPMAALRCRTRVYHKEDNANDGHHNVATNKLWVSLESKLISLYNEPQKLGFVTYLNLICMYNRQKEGRRPDRCIVLP